MAFDPRTARKKPGSFDPNSARRVAPAPPDPPKRAGLGQSLSDTYRSVAGAAVNPLREPMQAIAEDPIAATRGATNVGRAAAKGAAEGAINLGVDMPAGAAEMLANAPTASGTMAKVALAGLRPLAERGARAKQALSEMLLTEEQRARFGQPIVGRTEDGGIDWSNPIARAPGLDELAGTGTQSLVITLPMLAAGGPAIQALQGLGVPLRAAQMVAYGGANAATNATLQQQDTMREGRTNLAARFAPTLDLGDGQQRPLGLPPKAQEQATRWSDDIAMKTAGITGAFSGITGALGAGLMNTQQAKSVGEAIIRGALADLPFEMAEEVQQSITADILRGDPADWAEAADAAIMAAAAAATQGGALGAAEYAAGRGGGAAPPIVPPPRAGAPVPDITLGQSGAPVIPTINVDTGVRMQRNSDGSLTLEQGASTRPNTPQILGRQDPVIEPTFDETQPSARARRAGLPSPAPQSPEPSSDFAPVEAPQPTPVEQPAFTMPADLAKSDPRYRDQTLTFATDLDRAAYILASDKSKGESKGAGRIRAALEAAGINPEAAAAHGAAVKAAVKAAAKGATGVEIEVPAVPFAAPAAPVQAAAPQLAPGSDAGNGFRNGPNPGERYRVGRVAAVNGAIALEKRLPAGTAATFYIGKDGGLVDGDDVNIRGPGRERLWIPPNDSQAQRAQAILDEMGRLDLSDPARKAAKDRLKALVTSQPAAPVPAPAVEPAQTGRAGVPAPQTRPTPEAIQKNLLNRHRVSGQWPAPKLVAGAFGIPLEEARAAIKQAAETVKAQRAEAAPVPTHIEEQSNAEAVQQQEVGSEAAAQAESVAGPPEGGREAGVRLQSEQDVDQAVAPKRAGFPTKKAKPAKKPAAKSAAERAVERETITPAEDTIIGKNDAGETLYDRKDGSRYRMRFDRADKPSGYPDFGGDLVPVGDAASEETPPPQPVKAATAKGDNAASDARRIYREAYEKNFPGRSLSEEMTDRAADEVAQMIANKDADGLRRLNLGDPKAAPSARAVFEALTGVKLPRARNATEAAIDKWAGVTPEERQRRTAEKKAATEQRKAERETDASRARASRVEVNVTDTQQKMTGAEYVDGLIARGFTRAVTRGPKTYLVNAAGDGFIIPNKDMAAYARAQSMGASSQASVAEPPDSTTPAAEPQRAKQEPQDAPEQAQAIKGDAITPARRPEPAANAEPRAAATEAERAASVQIEKRNVWIPKMTPRRLDALLAKRERTADDIEDLKDFRYFLLTDEQSAAEKGFYEQYRADGGSVPIMKNKFWLTNINAAIAEGAAQPTQSESGSLEGKTFGEMLYEAGTQGVWLGRMTQPDGPSVDVKVIRWPNQNMATWGIEWHHNGKKEVGLPFPAIKSGMTAKQIADTFIDYMNVDSPNSFAMDQIGEKHARLMEQRSTLDQRKQEAEMAAMRKARGDTEVRPWDQTDLETKREIDRIGGRRFKTASEERMLELLTARFESRPDKWKVGDGVSYKVNAGGVGMQTNRGFRIIAKDDAAKTVTLRSVADTGLTSSGGNNDRIGDVEMHIGNLKRDRKYDMPEKEAAQSEAEQQAAPSAAVEGVEKPAAAVRDTSPKAERIRELEGWGVEFQARIDAYDPAEAVTKGRSGSWSYTTVQGNGHPSFFDTKREAIEAATRHRDLVQDMANNPVGYRDIVSVLARKRLEVIEREQKRGKSEMEAGKIARAEFPEWAEPTQETLSEAAVEEKKPAPAPAVQQSGGFDLFKSTMRAMRDGTASVDDYKEAYSRVRDSEATKAELGKLTKEELIRTFGIMRDGKKAELVETAYESMLDAFALGKQYGPRSYIMSRGGLEDHKRKKAEALDAIVEGHTADDLATFATEAKARMEEREARRSEAVKAIENPKTLEDFRRFMSFHTRDGKNTTNVRLSMLTPEQRSDFDLMLAEESRGKRKANTDEQRTQVRLAGQTVDGNIIATKHTKKGHDLFVVQLAERVSREDYETLNAGAKKIGGYYSSFRGGGAIPGFQFTTREQAEAFVTLAGGDATAAKEAAQDRRDAYADDRSQTAAERLTEMADRMEADADESLALERKVNTARRARFADSAEKSARAAKAMAKTMRNVAEALTSGKAKFLDRIRTKTQVELLQTYVANAKDAELRAKYESYDEREKRRGQPPTMETADYAEFPYYTAYRSDLATLARQLQDVDGTKKIGDRLMKVADDVSDAFTAWAKEPGNLFRLSTFSMRRGEDVKTAIFKYRETAERAIKRSGLTGKAIVFAEKRGVNRIIMSPSEAIANGLWTGDGDKRITLSDEFGAEMVESIGRVNRRGAKVSVPWQFERTYERRKQLSRMGIETPAEFRAALREFIGLREQAAEADRVKMLERAMIGRKNDGLDFFPTPESVADEMIAAAQIQPDMAVLEPSAGMGHIADRIRAAGAEPDVMEIASDRRELLEEKGYTLQGSDFLTLEPRKFFTYGDVFRAPDGREGIMRGVGHMGSQRVRLEDESGNRLGLYDRDELVGVRHRGYWSGYDRIIMNPPFSDGRDIEHVRHAYTLLKPGGRIVALMGESAFTSQNKRATEFREWLESVGGTDEKLPAGSFMDPSLPVNTSASARMVVIDKDEAPAGNVGFFSLPSTPAAPGKRPAPAAIKGMAARAASTFGVTINVVPNTSHPSVPERVRGTNPTANGYTDGFQAWVFTDNIVSLPHAAAVIAHEVVGHVGVEAITGEAEWQGIEDTVRGVLDGTIAANDNDAEASNRAGAFSRARPTAVTQEVARIIREARQRYPGASDRLLAKESVAIMAERGVKASMLDRILAALRRGLRRMFPSIAFTDAELRDLIARSSETLRSGARAESAGAEQPLFSQAPPIDSPEFRAWFGDSKVVDKDGRPLVVYRAGGATDHGGHFAFDRELAEAYADDERDVVAAYLSISKPLEIKTGEEAKVLWEDEVPGGFGSGPFFGGQDSAHGRLRAYAESKGHDGIIVWPSAFDDDVGYKWAGGTFGEPQLIAFRPDQIKSATGNVGAFGQRPVTASEAAPLGLTAEEANEAQAQGDIRFAQGTPDPSTPEGARAALRQIDDAIKARGTLDIATVKEFLGKGATAISDRTRRMRYMTLPRFWQVEFGKRLVPEAEQYRRLADRMSAEANAQGQKADEIANAWANLYSRVQTVDAAGNKGIKNWRVRAKSRAEQADRMADIMSRATVAGFDPDPTANSRLDENDNVIPAKTATEIALERDWKRLDPDVQALYRNVREYYVSERLRYFRALRDMIEATTSDVPSRRALIAKLKAEFEGGAVQAPYFPLARFGDYWVKAKRKADGTETAKVDLPFAMADTPSQQQALKDQMERDGWVVEIGKRMDDGSRQFGASSSFVQDVVALIDKHLSPSVDAEGGTDAGVDDRVTTALKDAVYQLHLQTLPELSMRKQYLHRTGRAGWSQDAMRAFAQRSSRSARQISKLRYGWQLAESLKTMRQQAENVANEDRNQAADVVSALQQNFTWTMNPQREQWSVTATQFGFLWYLGMTPAAALINLSQQAQFGFPYLATEYGGVFDGGDAKVIAAMSKANSDYVTGMLSRQARVAMEAELDGDLGRMLSELEESGKIDRTQTLDLSGIAESDASTSLAWRRGNYVMGFMFHHMERMNREAMAIATYRLERARGSSHETSVMATVRAIDTTQFNYESTNRAQFMQGSVMPVITLFKQYALNVTMVVTRAIQIASRGDRASKRQQRKALKQLTYIMGVTGLMAGAVGLPGVKALLGAVTFFAALFGGDDDEPFDAELEFRGWLARTFGEKGGEAIAKGPVNAVSGIELSQRVSLSELWWRSSDREVEGAAAQMHIMGNLLGPIFGLGVNAFRAGELASQGNFERAVESVTPKFVRDYLRMGRYADEGLRNLRGDQIIDQFTAIELTMQVVGFQPARVGEAYDEINAIMRVQDRTVARRTRLLTDVWNATLSVQRMEPDAPAELQAALAAVAAWNAANPDWPITRDALRQSMRSRAAATQRATTGAQVSQHVLRRVEDRRFATDATTPR